VTSSGFAIRAGRPQEADRVIEMYEWLFAAPGATPGGWDPAAAKRRWLAANEGEDSLTLVAEAADGALVGFCTGSIDLESVRFGRRCWVEDLAVDPSVRSRGVGAALLARARAWGSERGATHLELDSGEGRHDAHRFYERQRPSWRSNQYSWVLDDG
jgi:GNAT superfamily N-acetyltransferase